MLLVRVRRRCDVEPLEALELSFDKANKLKRKRFVTQSEALIAKFGASFSFEEAPVKKDLTKESEETKQGFVLGASVKTIAKEKEATGRNVTLRKLMPDTTGKSLDEIKKYHYNLISARRTARRQETLFAKRKELFSDLKGFSGENSPKKYNDDKQGLNKDDGVAED